MLIRGRGINHIEFQSFIIVFLKIGVKYQNLLSTSQKNMKTPKYQLYFHSSTISICLLQIHLISQQLECGNIVDKKAALISMWIPKRCSSCSGQGAY